MPAPRRRPERGATSIEYALVIAFCVLAIVAGVTATNNALGGFFDRVVTDVESWD